ncbi:CACTA en-spm transposon protein [Cucumis melo var. makuwa]|uniref:CACTA en-spm transposon protein n=1 Tax=Cucumis melo var. makuwa TaxID=1194695 RepID=A0A5A7SKH2_CUCMM|nr:CACTA en-spm transposon protein [Cucumis melo var. makuwa]
MQEQSRTNKVARQKQPYNYSSGSKSFLQRQHELAEKKGKSIDCVELFWKTHVRVGMFVSQVIEYVHNQMLELQSQPTLEGSQPFSRDKICDQVLGIPDATKRRKYDAQKHWKKSFPNSQCRWFHLQNNVGRSIPDVVKSASREVFPTLSMTSKNTTSGEHSRRRAGHASGMPIPTHFSRCVAQCAKNVNISFSNDFSLFSMFLYVGSTPVSCSEFLGGTIPFGRME